MFCFMYTGCLCLTCQCSYFQKVLSYNYTVSKSFSASKKVKVFYDSIYRAWLPLGLLGYFRCRSLYLLVLYQDITLAEILSGLAGNGQTTKESNV